MGNIKLKNPQRAPTFGKTTTSIPQTTQSSDGLENEFTIPQFEINSEENIKSEISQIVEKEKFGLLHPDFYNNTIAEFFKKTKNKTEQGLQFHNDHQPSTVD